MKIVIRKDDCTEVWDSVLYKKLSDYPNVTDWEIRTIIEFIEYEKSYGRDCEIVCEDKEVLDYINEKLAIAHEYRKVNRPSLLTECTACPKRKGCETEFVCHTTSIQNAISILKDGSLLSPVKARKMAATELAKEARNAANDPEDYFNYIMFAWGNCQAGDRLVMERKLGRFPEEGDLSINFTPGIRFYFKYDKLSNHPRCVFDGVLPFKIQDEVKLQDWLHVMVVPKLHENEIMPYIPKSIKDKVLFVENDCKDIWEWAEKVYEVVERMSQ